MERISTLTSVNITSPEGKPDVCPRFHVTQIGERFRFEDVAEAGKEYTLCFWVRSADAGVLTFYGADIQTSTAWKRYAVTLTAAGKNLELSFSLAGSYYLYHMKLELGAKATDYTPAPEDVDEELVRVRESVAQVDIKADSISASVSEYKESTDNAIHALDEDLVSVTKNVAQLEIKADSISASVTNVQTQVDAAETEIDSLDEGLQSVNESVAAVDIKADGISARVNTMNQSVSALDGSVTKLEQSVSTKMSAQDVQLQIKSAMSEGVSKVETTTGFTFNEEGMTVEKSGSEMKTQITEDGMTVSRSGDLVLVADNRGVDAENLRATTYLIIGNSRFENYGSTRTGCFWIGGN